MPRPISWLPRLHLISRSVTHSIRSHYDRQELENLFELQPRAAQKLLELLPTVQVGTSHLVDREVLGRFLDRVKDANEVPALYRALRAEKSQASRRKPRSLVRRDLDPIDIDSLPSTISLAPGRMVISFSTVEDLAEAMYALARVLEKEGDEFASRYEIKDFSIRQQEDLDLDAE